MPLLLYSGSEAEAEWLWGTVMPEIKKAASLVLAKSVKVVGILNPCFEN
ncbi:MAG: hypothetical protein ABF741_08140 [Liquorilactobacillus ghanensis]